MDPQVVGAPGFSFAPQALDAYRAAFRDPQVIHATCEDYQASATVDYQHDLDDRTNGRRILCPVLALWGQVDATAKPKGFIEIWKRWADNVTGAGLACGHFLPEEAPEDVLAHLDPFLEKTIR